ncbi:MAG: PaaI family thioesterase [Coprococcus sp.]
MARNEEVMKRYRQVAEKKDKFIRNIGIEITDGDFGYCRGEMKVEEHHKNPLGTVHGGCLYTLADTLGGFAAATYGFGGPTLSGNMYFMRPTLGVEKLICEARVIKNGKRIRVVEAIIYGDKGEEIARCMLEYMDLQKNIIKDETGTLLEEQKISD